MADDTTVILEADADDLLGDLSKVGLAAEETTSILGDLSEVELVPDGFLGDLSDIGLVAVEDKATEAIDALEELDRQAEEAAESVSQVGSNVDLTILEDSLDQIVMLLQEQIDATHTVTDAVQEEGGAVSTVTNNFSNYAAAVEESTTSTADFADETEKTKGVLSSLGGMAKKVGGFIANMFVIDITRIPKLIEKIGKKLFGGSEEFEVLQAQLDGMLHTIGGALLPVLEGIGKGFEVVRGVVEKLSPVIRNIAARFASFANGVIEAVSGMVVPAFEMIIEFATELAAQVTVSFQWIVEQAGVLWIGIVNVFDHIAELFGQTQGFAQMLADAIKMSWDSIAEVTSVTWAFVQTVIENWQLASLKVVTDFALVTITAFEDIKYFFTEVFPSALSWFGGAWADVFSSAGDFLGEVLGSMTSNIQNFFSAVSSWLQGDGFNFEFTGLEKGLELTLRKFPEIAERQRTMMENVLSIASEDLSTQFEDRLSQRLNENQALLDQARNSIKDAITGDGSEVPGLTFPDIEIKPPEKSGENDDKDTDGGKAGQLKTEKDQDKEETGMKGPTGLAELASGIQDALFNRTDPTTDAIKDGTQKSVKAMEAVAEGTKDVRKAVESLDTRARFS